MGKRKNPPGGDYEVGHKRPPVHTRFTSTHQPARRGRKRTPNSNEVLDILGEEIQVRKNGRKVRMSSFEIAARKLFEKALKEQNLDNAIEFLNLCEKYKLIKHIPGKQAGGVLTIPNSWNRDEWMAMFNRHGPPPWLGPRSGLIEYVERNASSSRKRSPESKADERRLHFAPGADPTRPVGHRNPPRETQFEPGISGNPKGRPSRDKTQKEIVERIASEKHLVTERDDRVERTTLDLVVLLIRSKAHEGNRKAFRIQARLLSDYGGQEPTEGRGYLVVSEPESREEWERKTAEQQRPDREGGKTGLSSR